ncbi:MAG: capsule assembly Wzi family protein [Chitinophagales bacterium]|nr:capsule assembly Wzi family protein [Chitinophagales bacterium]
MQSIKTIVTILIVFFCGKILAQTSYTPLGHKEYNLLERLDIKSKQPAFGASYQKPYNVRLLVKDVETIDSLQRNNNRIAATISKIDKYNITRFLMTHKEYTSSSSSFNNKKTSFNVIEINKPKFFMTVNPAVQFRYGTETDNKQTNYLISGGLEAKGLIGKKVAFNIYATGNQERTPAYVRAFTNKFHAVPGFSNYTIVDSNAVQYFDIRGSVQWTLAKAIDMQIGYDRIFIGNGQRSLFLSDFSGNSLFFKSNLRLWRFNFESLYMQLTPQFGIVNKANFKKYLRINTLSTDITRWLNIGIFDAVVFGRENQFELDYLLPFTFLRAMEQQAGSPDNALMGLNVKANINQQVQVYGQIILDEFLLSEIKANRGWWANKYGYQLGVKYIDAFKINNLDLQAEINRTRPFTYTHFDSVSNYSNNNMPVAHPLGAGFQEYILAAKYQPLKKLYLDAKIIYYYQGQDTAGQNMGTNILEDYKIRTTNYGWKVGSGDKATCIYFNANAAYEFKENFFIDAGIAMRNYHLASGTTNNTVIFNVGFRWNISRRVYEF